MVFIFFSVTALVTLPRSGAELQAHYIFPSFLFQSDDFTSVLPILAVLTSLSLGFYREVSSVAVTASDGLLGVSHSS